MSNDRTILGQVTAYCTHKRYHLPDVSRSWEQEFQFRDVSEYERGTLNMLRPQHKNRAGELTYSDLTPYERLTDKVLVLQIWDTREQGRRYGISQFTGRRVTAETQGLDGLKRQGMRGWDENFKWEHVGAVCNWFDAELLKIFGYSKRTVKRKGVFKWVLTRKDTPATPYYTTHPDGRTRMTFDNVVSCFAKRLIKVQSGIDIFGTDDAEIKEFKRPDSERGISLGEEHE